MNVLNSGLVCSVSKAARLLKQINIACNIQVWRGMRSIADRREKLVLFCSGTSESLKL